MKIRNVFVSFARLATGEVFGRMATFALFAYVSRRFGVQILGIVALAQTVAGYVMECSDQGLKLIGARLLARNHALATFVVPFVLKRRAALTAIAIVLGAMYALLGPVPPVARACVLVFDLAVIPYAFALDWVAWGLGHFGVLSIWRSGVSILYVAMAITAMHLAIPPDCVDIRREHLERGGGRRLPVDDVAAPLEEAPNRRGRGRDQGGCRGTAAISSCNPRIIEFPEPGVHECRHPAAGSDDQHQRSGALQCSLQAALHHFYGLLVADRRPLSVPRKGGSWRAGP